MLNGDKSLLKCQQKRKKRKTDPLECQNETNRGGSVGKEKMRQEVNIDRDIKKPAGYGHVTFVFIW